MKGRGITNGGRKRILYRSRYGALQSSRTLPCSTSKEQARGRKLEAGELAAREGMLKLFYHRNIYQQLSRGKIASRGSQGTKKSSRSSGLHAAKPKTTMPHRKGEQGTGVLWKRVQIQAKNIRGSAEYKLIKGRTGPRREPWRQSATGEIELGQSTNT